MPAISRRIAAASCPYNQSIRSKLLGWPTSMAVAIVRTDGRGEKGPDSRYCGTTSLTFVAATNFAIGSPALLASRPAVRLPKLPDGVQTIAGVGAASGKRAIPATA